MTLLVSPALSQPTNANHPQDHELEQSRSQANSLSRAFNAAAKEIDIARVLAGQVHGRVTRNFRKIDDNDDELVKDLATHAYEAEGYSWDTI